MVEILKKRRASFLIFPCVVVIIILMIYSASFLTKITSYNQLKNNIPVGEIFGERKIGQTFLAEYDGLSGIEVLLATYRRKNSGELIFHLTEDIRSKEDLFNYKVDINKVEDNKYFSFKFSKIKNSKGKKIYFYIEAPQSQPGNAITIWSHSKDFYKEGEKIVNGVVSEGDLVFKTKYSPELKNKFNAFLEKITQDKPFPLNNKSFYIILIVLFVLSTSLFLTFIVKFFMGI